MEKSWGSEELPENDSVTVPGTCQLSGGLIVRAETRGRRSASVLSLTNMLKVVRNELEDEKGRTRE